MKITEKDILRFWKKVNKTDGCWLWIAGCANTGYGAFSLNYRMINSHRFSWILHNGVIPDGLAVLHRCDIRTCVNPSHLFLGTLNDNNQDMIQKGRYVGAKGTVSNKRKLSDEDLVKIKELSLTVNQRQLAQMFNVSQTTIFQLLKGKNYVNL